MIITSFFCYFIINISYLIIWTIYYLLTNFNELILNIFTNINIYGIYSNKLFINKLLLRLFFVIIIIIFYTNWYIESETNNNIFGFIIKLFFLFITILLITNNIIILLMRWEIIRFISFMLISWWYSRWEANSRALAAVMYNRLRDMLIIVNLYVIINYNININNLMLILLLLSVINKSSLIFFNYWLPTAIERPTPVSSLLHSSTIVVARVLLYLIIVNYTNNFINTTILVLRLITSLYCRQISRNWIDIKKLIAFSTTTHLRIILLLTSLRLIRIRLLHILYHAFTKSILFIISGIPIHRNYNSQKLLEISNNYRNLSYLIVIKFSILSLSLMAVIRYSCIFSKEKILFSISYIYINYIIIFSLVYVLINTFFYSYVIYTIFSFNINSKIVTKSRNIFISNIREYNNSLIYIITITTTVIILFVININNIIINNLISNSNMPIFTLGLLICFIILIITKKNFFSIKGLRYYYIFNIKSNHKKVIFFINKIINKYILFSVKI